MGRSILAIVAPYLLITVLGIIAQFALFSALRIPTPEAGPDGAYETPAFSPVQTAVFVLVDGLIAFAGGVLCARLAPNRPVRHGLTLAAFLLLLGGASLVVAFGAEPVVYAVTRTFTAPVFAVAGAWAGQFTEKASQGTATPAPRDSPPANR